ncbi:hypothetical protein U8V72_20830 [Priestia filamentosa]|uniref:hypothetical protein n=1 Tax=Priestia filamentosa TaxID=1402861 RepID=UPI00397C45E9
MTKKRETVTRPINDKVNTSNRVTTKRKKFTGLARYISTIVDYDWYFKGYEPIRDSFTEEEAETMALLTNIWRNGLPEGYGKHHNNPEYDNYIQQALEFITSVLDKYVPVEDRILINDEAFEFENLTEFLNDKEINSWEVGSRFSCILDEKIKVKKIDLIKDKDGNYLNHIYGTVKSLTETTPELKNMGEGLYELVETENPEEHGARFDVQEYGEALIHGEGKETHPILKFHSPKEVEQEDWEDDWEAYNYYMGYSSRENCSNCGGGGCIHCRPNDYLDVHVGH